MKNKNELCFAKPIVASERKLYGKASLLHRPSIHPAIPLTRPILHIVASGANRFSSLDIIQLALVRSYLRMSPFRSSLNLSDMTSVRFRSAAKYFS